MWRLWWRLLIDRGSGIWRIFLGKRCVTHVLNNMPCLMSQNTPLLVILNFVANGWIDRKFQKSDIMQLYFNSGKQPNLVLVSVCLIARCTNHVLGMEGRDTKLKFLYNAKTLFSIINYFELHTCQTCSFWGPEWIKQKKRNNNNNNIGFTRNLWNTVIHHILKP